jgi:hypothetical protein
MRPQLGPETLPSSSLETSRILALDASPVDLGPVISSLNPDSIPDDATTTVDVSGSNFVSGLRVTTTISGATIGTPTDVTSTSFSVPVTCLPARRPAVTR